MLRKWMRATLLAALLSAVSSSIEDPALADVIVDFEENYDPTKPENFVNYMTSSNPLSGPLSIEVNNPANLNLYAVSSKSAFNNIAGPNPTNYFNDGDSTVAAGGFGAGGSNTWLSVSNYTLGDAIFTLPNSMYFGSVSINNIALLPYTFENGLGMFTDPFLPNGTAFFRIRFDSLDSSNAVVGQTDWIDLANYGKPNEPLDNFVLKDWTQVNLSSLNTNRLAFEFDGSDFSTYNGQNYLNTPTYVAFDNFAAITAVPEPNSMVLLSMIAATTSFVFRRRKQS